MSADSLALLSNYLNSQATSEGCLDFIACHGFITAIACRYDECNADDLLKIIVDAEPSYQSTDEKVAIQSAFEQLFKTINRQLYLGEDIDFPMALKPSTAGATNDLSDWCFGYMEAVGCFEEEWFISQTQSDAVAELLLPISVFSQPHVEPELSHLVKTANARTALAEEIPDNLQQLYLLFRD